MTLMYFSGGMCFQQVKHLGAENHPAVNRVRLFSMCCGGGGGGSGVGAQATGLRVSAGGGDKVKKMLVIL